MRLRWSGRCSWKRADGLGFEPRVPAMGTAVFKTAALVHSATHPVHAWQKASRGSRSVVRHSGDAHHRCRHHQQQATRRADTRPDKPTGTADSTPDGPHRGDVPAKSSTVRRGSKANESRSPLPATGHSNRTVPSTATLGRPPLTTAKSRYFRIWLSRSPLSKISHASASLPSSIRKVLIAGQRIRLPLGVISANSPVCRATNAK